MIKTGMVLLITFLLTLIITAIINYKRRCNPLVTNCRKCRYYSAFCYAESGNGYLCKATEKLPNKMLLCFNVNDGKCKLFKPNLFPF